MEVLETATDAKEAAQLIRRNRALLADAMEAHRHLQHLVRRMDRTEVLRRLQDFVLHFGPPKFAGDMVGEQGAAALNNAWVDSWTRHLQGLTPEALSFAVDRWMQSGKPFWPKPSELISLGQALAAEQHKLAYRVKVACQEVPTMKAPPSDEEKAQVAAQFAEFSEQLKAKRSQMTEPLTRPSKPNDEFVRELVAQGLRRAQEDPS